MKRKFLALFLSILMLVSLLPTAAMAEGEEGENGTNTEPPASTVWNGTVADAFAGGDGTQASPYEIANGAQLAYLAQQVNDGTDYSNKYFKLTADIDLGGSNSNQWTPIGGDGKPFKGTFDGGYMDGETQKTHVISNLYVHSTATSGKGFGLFGNAATKVANLTLKDVHVMGNSAVAALAGMSNATIDNVKVTGRIEIGTTTNQGTQANFNSSYIGGIVGWGYPKVSNCEVSGDGVTTSIIGGRQVGGIIGFCGEGYSVRAKDCVVSNITLKGGKSVGGIVGWAHYGNGITDCSVVHIEVRLNASVELNSLGLLVGTSYCNFNAAGKHPNTYAGCSATNSKLYVNDVEQDISRVDSLYSIYGADYYIYHSEAEKDVYDFYDGKLSSAVTNAANGQTIGLVNNVSETITIPDSKDLTIDLNGYTLSGNITNNGTLTIKNGKVWGTITGNKVIFDNATVAIAAAYVGSESNSYATLQEAVNAAAASGASYQYIHLKADNTENITIPASTTTIYLYDKGFSVSGDVTNNGVLAFKTSRGTNKWNITNNGELIFSKNQNTGCTVMNNGTLNITDGKTYDLSKITNNKNGRVSITGGTFSTKPDDTWIAFGYIATQNEGADTYIVRLMIDAEAIAAGAVARYKTDSSSYRRYYKTVQEGIQNGALHLLANVNEDVTKDDMIDLACEDYTFTGSLSCPGFLYIKDGTAILKNIECGTFFGGYASNTANITVKNGTATDIEVARNATVFIEGGTYTGSITMTTGGSGSLTISGGYFTSNPAAYVAEGKTVLPSDKAGYTYMVGTPTFVGETNTEVAPAPETTPKADVGNMTSTDGSAASSEEKAAVATAIESATSNGLNTEAAAVANDSTKVTVAHVNTGLSAAKTDLGVDSEADASAIKLVVQPYLDIEAKSYTATATEKTLNVEITPKYNLLATKSDTDVTALSTADDAGKNAVIVESNKDLPTDENTQVTINFQLPSGFITDDEQMDKVFVVHTKQDRSTETYKATVTKSGSTPYVYTATFTTNGFSPFVFTVDTRSAQVQFKDKDGNSIGSPVTYLPTNVGDALPTTAAPDGQIFGGWQFADINGTYTTLTDALLTALDTKTDPITATPYFYTPSYGGGSGSSTTTYPVSASSNVKNGTVTVSPKNAAKGATVTITVTPDKGYELDSLTVTDKNGDQVKLTDKGNGKYTFTMPASKVDVKTSFVEAKTSGTNPFVDVSESAYYYDAVLWAVENGITGGTTATTFSPNASCTRAQAVTFLWRAAGSPAPKSSAMPFGDVAADAYYHDAVLWAMEQGITQGTTATAFSPNAVCTRGQIVTFLWRAEASEAAGTVSAFTDVASNAYYAGAVDWAVENGITQGTTATTFSPAMNCTRAQIVTFLYRDYQGK